MITFRNATLRLGARVLLTNINWTIFHKQRIGIVGHNGTGKSTLLAVLMGKLHIDAGDLELPRQMRFAHVAQETPALSVTAVDFVLDGDHEFRTLQRELAEAEDNHDGEKIALLHEKMYAIDGYTAEARASQLLNGLGFSPQEQQKQVSEFSGGWRMRLNLAQALMCRSDILLLDEPTNHLDLDAVLWLEQWLNNYHGTLILISHDRDFLDKTVNYIVYLHQQALTVYSGNYSAFETQRANELMLQQAMYERQQKQLAHLQKFVDRFKAKASKAKQAQSRVKAIERMDLVCAVQTESPFHFEFREPEQCPYPLLAMDRVSAGYDDRVIINNLSMSLTPKDRITILGPNGAGKSTLIKLLAGQIQPTHGTRTAGQGLKIGYFAQHQVDNLHLDDSPLLHLQRLAPRVQEAGLRTFLGGFGFVGDRVFEPVRQFSGGEKSRLALALIVWQRPNLLLLDEPTNHLDLEMRQALSIALQEYEGAMILVSHDRYLVRTTTDQLYLLADGTLREFDGDLTDYQRWLTDYRKQQKVVTPKVVASDTTRKEQRQTAAQARDKLRLYAKRVQQLEEKMERIQAELASIDAALGDDSIYLAENKDKLQQYLLTQAEQKKNLVSLEHEWLEACDERDKLMQA